MGFKNIFHELAGLKLITVPILTDDNRTLFTRLPAFDAYAQQHEWVMSDAIRDVGKARNAILDGVISNSAYVLETIPKLEIYLKHTYPPTLEDLSGLFIADCERQNIKPGPVVRALELLKRSQCILFNEDHGIIGFIELDMIQKNIEEYCQQYELRKTHIDDSNTQGVILATDS